MEDLPPSIKGGVAELAIAAIAARAGFGVSRPLTDGGRYDLVLDDGQRLLRVQCKWARRIGSVVQIRTRTCRRSRAGYVRGTYSAADADAVAAYCAELGRAWLLPIDLVDGRQMVNLRLSPARNNQTVGVTWAAEYELGAIAQLGERLHGMQEVAGSSPASSIAV